MPIRQFSKLTPLIAAATIAITTGLTVASPAHAQDFIVNLMSVQNSKCLQPLNGSLERGVAIVQEICNGSPAQQWTSAPAPHGMTGITFTNGASGMCLDARGKSAAGTPIQQWPCAPGNGISNQFWNYSLNGNELVSEVKPNPNSYCLATFGKDENDENKDGNPMVLQPCDGNNNAQLWNHPLSAPIVPSSGNLNVWLPTELPITPSPGYKNTEVLWVGDWLKPGEKRRVTGQLAIRIPVPPPLPGGSPPPVGKEVEVNNRVSCFDEGLVNNIQLQADVSSGTNYPIGDGQDYQWNVSMLLVAPSPLPVDDNGVSPQKAFFNCQLLVYTNNGKSDRTSYQMFVVPPQAPLNLVSVQNSKCLQPLNGSLEGGVAIVQAICNGSLAQQWMSAPAHKGMTFTNGASGMCLDARGKSAAGTPIQQWPCAPGNGISNQFWNYGAKGNELVSEVDPSPNSYCLAPGNDDGNPMVLQRCEGNSPQQWNHPLSAGRQTIYGTWLQMSSSDQGPDAQVWFFPNPPALETPSCPPDDNSPKVHVLCTYIDADSPVFIIPTMPTLNLVSVQSGKCLQPLNGSSERGVAIVQATCNGSLAQQWTSAPADPSSGMTFTNGASGMCLDARGKSAAGTPIQQWPCAPGEGISNQFWNYGAKGNELVSEVRPNPNSYCLAPGNDDGNPMVLQPCDGNSPQLWNQTWQNFKIGPDVTAIDGEATMEVTTCYSDTIIGITDFRTGSCKTSEARPDGQSTGNAYLEFRQLNPDGSTCQVTRAYSEVGGKPVFDEQFSVDKNQHHLPLYWHVSAPVSQLCNGSHVFSADLYMQYVNGNPIKIEKFPTINFIDSATAPTTTVPYVIGLTEEKASAAIVAAGLTASPQINLQSPPDIVTAQNAPAGTVEPMGSPVQITVGVRPRNP
jgi:Ricin-type beta-trefoil lectin domain